MHINEYTDAEYDACFYTSTDYKSFKNSIKKLVSYVESTSNSSCIKPYTRGVDRYAKVNWTIIRERRSVTYDIVHNYQDVSEYMAKLLKSSCTESQKEARIRGFADEDLVYRTKSSTAASTACKATLGKRRESPQIGASAA
jgi:hypothetical protein